MTLRRFKIDEIPVLLGLRPKAFMHCVVFLNENPLQVYFLVTKRRPYKWFVVNPTSGVIPNQTPFKTLREFYHERFILEL